MNCSYCNAPMKDGYLKCSHRLKWGTEKTLAASDEDVVLSKRMFQEMLVGAFHMIQSAWYTGEM